MKIGHFNLIMFVVSWKILFKLFSVFLLSRIFFKYLMAVVMQPGYVKSDSCSPSMYPALHIFILLLLTKSDLSMISHDVLFYIILT